MKKAIVLSPHNDDETLFAAFTIIREAAHVVVCYGSSGDYGTTEQRMQESAQAVATLGGSFEQWEVKRERELRLRLAGLTAEYELAGVPYTVFAPAEVCSHQQHVELAGVAFDMYGRYGDARLTQYQTYHLAFPDHKVRYGNEVKFEPAWVHRKLRALSCYASQATHPRASAFFAQDLREYYGGTF